MFLQNQVIGAAGDTMGQIKMALQGTLNTIGEALPGVISAFVILFIGYIIAKIVKTALTRVLKAVKFNDIADKVGINSMLSKGGMKSDASGLMGKLGYWIVMFTTLILFFNKLGLPAVSELLSDVVAFIPKLIVGCILLIVGMYGANFLRDMAVSTLKAGGFSSPNLVGNIAYGGVMFLVVSMVLDQIGIGGDIVNTLVTSVLGGLSIAAAIAFGLGGKDWAAAQIKKVSKMD
jgi:small-conductance mechanosensitive channel